MRLDWDRIRTRLSAAAQHLALPRDVMGLAKPATLKQPTSLYRVPRKPGFIGGYNWKAAAVGLASLFLANVAATEFVAWMFVFQRGLGPAWLRIDGWGLYAPWMWAVWVWRHSAAHDPRTRMTVLFGPLLICIGTMVSFALVYGMNLRRTRQLSEGTGDLHGSAQWAKESDLAEAGVLDDGDGVYIGGWWDESRQQLQYLRHNGPEHVLAFAPTRSGKGVSLVIPTILGWNESAVIYDIKGENWAKTAGSLRSRAHLVLHFAPCDASGKTTRFNPLREIRVGTLRDVSDAQNVADILVKNIENKPNDTHWIDTAAMVVTGALLHICYVAHGGGREANLAELASLFSVYGRNFRDTLKEMATTVHDPLSQYHWELPDGRPTQVHPTVREAVQKMLDKADKEFSSVVSTINTALAIYADPLVRMNTAASDFTVNDLVNFEKPVTLYIVVPPSDRLRLAPLLRLVFTLIVNRLTYRMAFAPPEETNAPEESYAAKEAAEEATGEAAAPGPVTQVQNRYRLLLMIDEFPTLKKMELFADALSYMGGYGIKAYLIAQDLQQILENYGSHESIVSNCHVRVAFAPNKIETAKLLSDMTGTETIEKASYTFSGSRVSPMLDHISSSVQQISRPLMTPDEVMRLVPAKKTGNGRSERIAAPGEMLIFVSGYRPILGTQLLYFFDPYFSRQAQIPPPVYVRSIEDGVERDQRPLHLARHRLSRPEKSRPAERETQPITVKRSGDSDQVQPPGHSFHTDHLTAQDPHYVPQPAPPKRIPSGAAPGAPEHEAVHEEIEAEV